MLDQIKLRRDNNVENKQLMSTFHKMKKTLVTALATIFSCPKCVCLFLMLVSFSLFRRVVKKAEVTYVVDDEIKGGAFCLPLI